METLNKRSSFDTNEVSILRIYHLKFTVAVVGLVGNIGMANIIEKYNWILSTNQWNCEFEWL